MLVTISRQYTKSIYFVGLLPIVESMVQPMPWANDRGHSVNDVVVYDRLIKQVCDTESVVYIPMDDVFGEEPKKYLIDGIHPSADGHELIFQRVKTILEQENII